MRRLATLVLTATAFASLAPNALADDGLLSTTSALTGTVTQTTATLTGTASQVTAPVTQTVTQAVNQTVAEATAPVTPLVESTTDAVAPVVDSSTSLTTSVTDALAPVVDTVTKTADTVTEPVPPAVDPREPTGDPVPKPETTARPVADESQSSASHDADPTATANLAHGQMSGPRAVAVDPRPTAPPVAVTGSTPTRVVHGADGGTVEPPVAPALAERNHVTADGTVRPRDPGLLERFRFAGVLSSSAPLSEGIILLIALLVTIVALGVLHVVRRLLPVVGSA